MLAHVQKEAQNEYQAGFAKKITNFLQKSFFLLTIWSVLTKWSVL